MRTVPRVLSNTQQLKSAKQNEKENQKLRKQVTTFIKEIKGQFSNMVNKYERQISDLKLQSQINKGSQFTSPTATYKNRSGSHHNSRFDLENCDQSPILAPKHKSKFTKTSASGFYRTNNKSQVKGFPETWSSAFEIKNISPSRYTPIKETNSFPIELINPQFQNEQNKTLHRSRFERKSQVKKQHQEEIIHFLQSRRKNLDETTFKMMKLIGKVPKQNFPTDSQDEDLQFENSAFKTREEQLNQSLSQICDSLDKSFISQKARKSKKKQKQAQEEQKRKNKQQQEKNQKIRKQRALKNLLSRLRQNANSVTPTEIVKNTKLIPTGPKTSVVFQQNKSNVVRKNSKVMINPVPMNQKSHRNRSRSPTSPAKRPTSILKQSSNILTKSISGISAISFIQ